VTAFSADLNTYNVAETLRAIASDSLYTLRPGQRAMHIDAMPHGLTVIGRFTEDPWGTSATLTARDDAGEIHASAEAWAAGSPSISTLIRNFRTAHLLWTHTDRTPWRDRHASGQSYTAIGRYTYRLDKTPSLDGPSSWALRLDHLNIAHPAFATVTEATGHILGTLEQQPRLHT
jgi:hypothetical protein